MRTTLLRLLPALAAAVLVAGEAPAYNVFPFGNDQALKWGSNDLGTPGGVVTWSLIPDGTALDPLVAGFNWSGTSDLASVYAQVGGQAAALDAIQAALDAWSSAADIQFVQVEESGGLALGAATAGTAARPLSVTDPSTRSRYGAAPAPAPDARPADSKTCPATSDSGCVPHWLLSCRASMVWPGAVSVNSTGAAAGLTSVTGPR